MKVRRIWIVFASLMIAQVGSTEGQSEALATWCVNAPPDEREIVSHTDLTDKVTQLLAGNPAKVVVVCGEVPIASEIRGGPLKVEWERKEIVELAYYRTPKGKEEVPEDEKYIGVVRVYTAVKPLIGAWNIGEGSNERWTFDPSTEAPTETFIIAVEQVFGVGTAASVSASVGVTP